MHKHILKLRPGVIVLFFCVLSACDPHPTAITVTKIVNPAPPGATLPNLTASSSGAILSWVQPESAPTDTLPAESAVSGPEATAKTRVPMHSLQMTRFDLQGQASAVVMIAKGRDWFLNWADFPSVYALDDERLAAHWLRRSGQSTYAYDVVTSLSYDGVHWTEPEVPHLDGTQTEHGFASFYTRKDLPALVWLDGRNTMPSGGDHAGHTSGNAETAMTLRTRTLERPGRQEGVPTKSNLLDPRVCDCCQTSAVNTDEGAIVFYRNRTEHEIRDIAFVRYDEKSDSWSEPAIVFDDGWKINGCPVNGPQADAHGRLVAVAWFTAVPTPRVQVAVSRDSGKTFDEPVLISDAHAVGRVSLIVLDTQHILVSWLERHDSDSAQLKAQLLDADLKRMAAANIALLSASRRSGFARLATLTDRSAMIAWTDWTGESSSVLTARIDIQ